MLGNPPRIVAIDSDAAIGQRLVTAFWGPEYQFHWFPDGRTALGELQKLQPDVIISELILPGIDGRLVLETVRLWPEFREVPFLVLSSVRTESVIRAMFDAGATAYLVKPCSVAQLKDAIHAALKSVPKRRRRQLKPRHAATRSDPVGEKPSNGGAQPSSDTTLEFPPVVASETAVDPNATDAAPTASHESEASVLEAWDDPPQQTRRPRLWARPLHLSWRYVPGVAAAVLGLGLLLGRPGSSWVGASDPSVKLMDSTRPPVQDQSNVRLASPVPTAEPAPQTPIERPGEPQQRSTESNQRLVQGRLEWAQALYDDGRYDDAGAALREVFRLAPSNEKARQLAAKLDGKELRANSATEPSASAEDHRGVLALLGRYETAFDRADASSLAAIWPAVDPQVVHDWWNGADSRQLTLRLIDLEVTGDTAVAMCVSHDRLLTTDGEKREGSSRVTFELRRVDGSWLIDAVK